jgi:cytoskeletal protein CcmA (bactofilin family)
MGVRYSLFVSYLTRGLQEQQLTLETLEDRLEEGLTDLNLQVDSVESNISKLGTDLLAVTQELEQLQQATEPQVTIVTTTQPSQISEEDSELLAQIQTIYDNIKNYRDSLDIYSDGDNTEEATEDTLDQPEQNQEVIFDEELLEEATTLDESDDLTLVEITEQTETIDLDPSQDQESDQEEPTSTSQDEMLAKIDTVYEEFKSLEDTLGLSTSIDGDLVFNNDVVVNGELAFKDLVESGNLTSEIIDAQTLVQNVNSIEEEVSGMREELDLLNELLTLSQADLSTDSADNISIEDVLQTSQSALSNASGFLGKMTELYNNFVEFSQNLGLSASEDGGLLVTNDLNVLGEATFSDLRVTGDLFAGQIKLDTLENSVQIAGFPCVKDGDDGENVELCEAQTLYLQKNLAGNVDIFDGKIRLEPNGTVLVDGTVLAKKIETISYAIDESSQMVGNATLITGEIEITIENDKVEENSRIFVTPLSSTKGQSLYISDKKQGESFTVKIDNPVDHDIKFDWWILEVTDNLGQLNQ